MWNSAIFDGHHPRSQKLLPCSAVHCTLDRLQSVDLTFRLSVSPGQVDGVTDSVDITAKYTGKTDQEARINCIVDPLPEFRRGSATKYAAKWHGEGAQTSKRP